MRVREARAVITVGHSTPRRRPSKVNADQLTFDQEREIERVAGGIRELHSKREFSGVCSEAYRLCCEKLRSLSPPTFTALMRDLEDE